MRYVVATMRTKQSKLYFTQHFHKTTIGNVSLMVVSMLFVNYTQIPLFLSYYMAFILFIFTFVYKI